MKIILLPFILLFTSIAQAASLTLTPTGFSSGNGTFTDSITAGDGTPTLPSYSFSSIPGSGIYRAGSSGLLGFSSQSNRVFRMQFRSVNGDDNAILYCGTGAAITNTSNDTFVSTFSIGTLDHTGNARFIGWNIGNNVINATDTTTRTAGQCNIEFDKTVYNATGGAVTWNKVSNSRFRLAVAGTADSTIIDNIGIDFVVPTSGVNGPTANYICVNIPTLSGGGGTNFYGMYFRNTPNGGSIASAASTDITITPGSGGIVKLNSPTVGGTIAGNFAGSLLSDGTTLQSLLPGSFSILTDEFFNVTSGGGGALGFIQVLANGGTVGAAAPTAGHPSLIQLRTSTATNGVSSIRPLADSIVLGGGRMLIDTVVRIPTLSDGTDTFTTTSGIFDSFGVGDQVDGIYAVYSSAADYYTNVTKWSFMSSSNSVRSELPSAITVGAGTFYRLTMDINAGATGVDCYIDGVLIGSLTTNIPGAGRYETLGHKIEKTVGTTSRNFDLDYYTWAFKPTTAR